MQDRARLVDLAKQFRAGRLSLDDFLRQITPPPAASAMETSAAGESSAGESSPAGVAELGAATLDLARAQRCGFPEVVFGEGKPVELLFAIFHRLLEAGAPVLATRVAADKAERLAGAFPQGRYNALARTFRVATGAAAPTGAATQTAASPASEPAAARVAVVTAGSGDLPVAEEARETLDWMGVPSTLVCDVGVAGPQRLLAHVPLLRQMRAVVVAAGMEGALPSVVGGHVACPVIGVPTSVGYGANFAGLAALLSMLNSCAANVAVVNIDAGFKAGYLAGLIARRGFDLAAGAAAP